MFDFIIVMAGSGKRMDLGYNKALYKLNNLELYMHSVIKALSIDECDSVILVTSEPDYEEVVANVKDYLRVKVVIGGEKRSDSVLCGLKAAKNNYCLIHDAARPFVKREDILAVYNALIKNTHCAILASRVVDTIKMVGSSVTTLDRSNLISVSTPQGVNKDEEIRALEENDIDFLDDASVFESVLNVVPEVVYTSSPNPKLTTKSDLEAFCVGEGYDIHRIIKGDGLMIGGVKVSSNYKFVAHSDGDVLIHAIINAICGAMGSSDIGEHFPNTDLKYKDIDSKSLASIIMQEVKEKHYVIHNIDVSIILEYIKLSPFKDEIRKSIMELFDCDIVSIKANTNEGIGKIGKGKACAILVRTLLRKE